MGMEGFSSGNKDAKKPTLDELTLKNAELNQELDKVKKDQKSLSGDYSMEGSSEPVTGELGLNADELSLKYAQLSQQIEKNQEAMKKEGGGMEGLEMPS